MILSTIEMHTGGEPTRIIVDGWPHLAGAKIAAYTDGSIEMMNERIGVALQAFK